MLKNNIFQFESSAKHANVEYCVLKPLEQSDEINPDLDDENSMETLRFIQSEQ